MDKHGLDHRRCRSRHRLQETPLWSSKLSSLGKGGGGGGGGGGLLFRPRLGPWETAFVLVVPRLYTTANYRV
ncbi:hypothetical protein CGRA01v4_13714 [Colletotrichum graminicola]|nr:hypothetical protein CGRA01v4_13714 [Colletotrichum graminicola]